MSNTTELGTEPSSARSTELRYEPWDLELHQDPYPTFRRLREEAPLYRNEAHDFWALSRYDDVAAGSSAGRARCWPTTPTSGARWLRIGA